MASHSTQRGCRVVVPKRQRVKEGIEKKKNGANSKRKAEPPSSETAGEKEAKYGKEGKESESGKKDVGCWLGAKRNGGVQIWRRTRQSRGRRRGPPLFSSQRCTPSPFYHLAFSLCLFFQLLFLASREGPGRLTKVDGSQRCTHTHTCVCSGSHLQHMRLREAAPFFCIPRTELHQTSTGWGRQAGSM